MSFKLMENGFPFWSKLYVLDTCISQAVSSVAKYFVLFTTSKATRFKACPLLCVSKLLWSCNSISIACHVRNCIAALASAVCNW